MTGAALSALVVGLTRLYLAANWMTDVLPVDILTSVLAGRCRMPPARRSARPEHGARSWRCRPDRCGPAPRAGPGVRAGCPADVAARRGPPSAIMLSAGMWMPHSQHETTAVPPGRGLESAAVGGRAGRWLRRPAGRSAAVLTARSGLSRRLQPWLLLVPCQLAAADLVTGCPGRARWQVHPDRGSFGRNRSAMTTPLPSYGELAGPARSRVNIAHADGAALGRAASGALAAAVGQSLHQAGRPGCRRSSWSRVPSPGWAARHSAGGRASSPRRSPRSAPSGGCPTTRSGRSPT